MTIVNELVATHVMGYTRDKMEQDKRVDLQIAILRDPGVRQWKQSEYHWPPAYDSDGLFVKGKNQIDARMEELGLLDAYVRAIVDVLTPECTHTDIFLLLMNVTNTQRCMAALRVMGIKL